jgi:hypothetical protein
MGHLNEDQTHLWQRWEQTAQTIRLARMRERQESTERILQATLSSLLTFGFIVGMSVWLAQRIMMQ